MHHSRRHFLKGSACFLGSGFLGTTLLPRLVRAQANPAKKLILVTCNGGWDVTFHLDPKPAGLTTVSVPAGGIVTQGNLSWFSADACNGVVDAYFAAHADVSSIVRGISVRSISHDVCTRRMMTGSPSEDAPDIGVITGATHGPELPAPYLALGAISFPGRLEGHSVRMGVTNQLALAHKYDVLAPEVGANFPNGAERDAIRTFLDASADRMANARGQFGDNAARIGDYQTSLDRVDGLYANREALGDPFVGAGTLQQQMTNALTMLESGVSYAVNVSTGFVWDTHDPAQAPTGTYAGAQGIQNQTLWPALTYLIEQLKLRDGSGPGTKLIDETVVVVLSEMTRTPLFNQAGGKDHWPHTSALVVGGGVDAGRVFGGTDDSLTADAVDLATGAPSPTGTVLESSHFAAGVLQLVGVNAAEHLPLVTPLSALVG